MGVSEEKLADVSKVLRAGTPKGDSSTSTAIIYQRSDDDMFGISARRENNNSEVPTIEKCDRDEFIDKLKQIRKKVEEQSQEDI